MLHLHSLTVCFVLSAMAAVTCLADNLIIDAITPGAVYSGDQPPIQCDNYTRASQVCYKCALRYEDFGFVHNNCCSSPSNEWRIYCEKAHTAQANSNG